MDENSKKIETTPVIGVVLMVIITIILAAVTSFFVFGMAGYITRIPYQITVTDFDSNLIIVSASDIESNAPLSNVQIGIYSYSDNTLLLGPLFTNESGLVSFDKPAGFDNQYRVKSVYNGITITKNTDNRSIFVKFDEFFGSFTALIIGFISFVGAIIFAWFKREELRSRFRKIGETFSKIGKRKDEL